MLNAAPPLGRSKRLLERRNNKILLRYYYWRELHRRRQDDIFRILSEDEFFLEEITLRRIFRENIDAYLQLKVEKPSEKELQHFSFLRPPAQLEMFR